MFLISSAAKLSARLDNELDINLKLSVDFILCDIFTTLSLSSLSIFVISFLIGTEKVIYFSAFSPKHSNICPLNSFASPLIIK